jgi:uncharacterized protein (TIGR02147 family)
MKSIYLFKSYKEFIISELSTRERGGYGQFRRLADSLGVHSTLISQVLKGPKDLTFEQAASVATYLNLSELESDYFLLLVHSARAGNQELKAILQRQITALREQGQKLSTRISKEVEISKENQAIFYSDWVYSAVRQALAIPENWSVEKLSERLNLKPKRIKEVLQFLLETGLIVQKEAAYHIGPKATHLDSSSPWAKPHHMNWRQKAMSHMAKKEENDLFITCPMTLSKADASAVHELLVQAVQKIFSNVDNSPSEQLYSLNIDWVKVL